jgi:hypothetical protein
MLEEKDNIMEHEITPIKKISVQPDMKLSSAIGPAMKKLGPFIKEAKKRILAIPLRNISDPHTGEDNWVRFATSEELQRIVMETCEGMISVTTLPQMFGMEPVVRAFVFITTSEGLYQLPGCTASQSLSTINTAKAILSAESRAIRRALKELGLRAEYEIYDGEDGSLQSSIDKSQEVELSASEKTSGDVKVSSVKKKLPVSDAATKKSDNKKPVSKVEKQILLETPEKTVVEKSSEVPTKKLAIEINRDTDGWPDKRATSYLSKLLIGLEHVRKNDYTGMNVEKFVKRVLGSDAFSKSNGKRRVMMTSLVTEELETLYQHYVIEQEEL